MRQPLLLASLLLLGACASPLPAADPNMAWIDLKGEAVSYTHLTLPTILLV